ncbi:calcium-binding protein [Nocardioides sp. MH1]|uniref:calcium-binding protein n=1 Tax=Nocardioides sp. MH1 TaxID=3242490 RepID=UPI003522899F
MRRVLGGGAAACLVAALGAGVPATTAAAPVRLCNGLQATIVGTAGDDHLVGTDGDDVIVALAGDDGIESGAGDDTVCGNGGSDQVFDLGGDDVVIGGDGDDSVIAGEGHDVVRLGAGKDYFDLYGDPGPVDLWLGPGDDAFALWLPAGGSVNAGPGDDDLNIVTVPGVPATLIGGEGLDLLTLRVDESPDTSPVYISERTATLRLGRGPRGRMRGWESYLLFGDHDWVYRGTNGKDAVAALDGRLRAHLYGGDDFAQVRGVGPHYIDAGSGSDYVDGSPRYAVCVAAEFGACSPNP